VALRATTRPDRGNVIECSRRGSSLAALVPVEGTPRRRGDQAVVKRFSGTYVRQAAKRSKVAAPTILEVDSKRAG